MSEPKAPTTSLPVKSQTQPTTRQVKPITSIQANIASTNINTGSLSSIIEPSKVGSENTSAATGQEVPKEPIGPKHNGRPVDEIAIMIERPQHLITPTDGTYQFTRLYYNDGKYVIHQGEGRLGMFRVLYAEYDRGRGLNIMFSQGYRVHVPDHLLQVSYVLADPTIWF